MVTLPRLPALTVHDHALVWQVPESWTALSGAAVGGGLTTPAWVLNLEVDKTFDRTDLDAYVAEVTTRLGLPGPACALITAVDVAQVQTADSGGVRAWATVGVTRPTWAMPPSQPSEAAGARTVDAGTVDPGTVNIVVAVDRALSPAALVQAVGTVTEAKAQVLVQAGVPGTGTASDAVVVLCPSAGEPVAFAGVRSPQGADIARTVHAAVSAGLDAHPWPTADVDQEVVW